jgi:hypothetical protein
MRGAISAHWLVIAATTYDCFIGREESTRDRVLELCANCTEYGSKRGSRATYLYADDAGVICIL